MKKWSFPALGAPQLINYVLLIVWAGVIFYLSSEGSDASSGRSDGIVAVVQGMGATAPADVISFWVRKSAHTVAYFVFGMLAYRVVRGHGVAVRRAVGIAVVIALGYAISDELHQHIVPGRSPEIRDVLIDTTAGAVGASAYAMGEVAWARMRIRIRTRANRSAGHQLNKPVK